MTESKNRQRPKWTEVLTALSTIVGGGALAFAAYQYYDSRQQSKIDLAIRVISDRGPERTYTSQHCLSAGNELGKDNLMKLHDRERVSFTSDAQTKYVGRCLADLEKKDREEVYDFENNKPIALTPRGAALLAQRVNHALNEDEFISGLIINRIADEKLLLDEFKWRVCYLDKPLVEKVYEVVEQKEALRPLQAVIATACLKK